MTSALIGCLLAIVFGAANAYLGLLVGMTISASIPAAVISMGIIRVILRRDSILENNLVQTIGSAGESLAAVCDLHTSRTVPLGRGRKDRVSEPSYYFLHRTVRRSPRSLLHGAAPSGSHRREHGTLPFPEGTACAEVLLAGEEGGSKAGSVFTGLGIAALYKFIADGLKLFPSEIGYAFPELCGIPDRYPGAPVACRCRFHLRTEDLQLHAGRRYIKLVRPDAGQSHCSAATRRSTGRSIDPRDAHNGGRRSVSSVVKLHKYIGAGAVAAGGIISLIKTFPLIIRTFKQAMASMSKKHAQKNALRTQQICRCRSCS